MKYQSIDEYILNQPKNIRVILEKIKKIIKEGAPKAEEKMTYNIPTFFLNGNLVHFAAFKNHIGFFPTPSAIKEFEKDLKNYKSSKGAIQFPMDDVPYSLIKEIVKFRVNEMTNLNKKKNIDFDEDLQSILKTRFEKNTNRHKGLEWAKIQVKLNEKNLSSLYEMERTGGEPDVVILDKDIAYVDCSPESPVGRRSICYDNDALNLRKENKPANNALDMAAAMGIEMLNEEQYRQLQKFGVFDTKTSSWVKTPSNIRKLGGALFCDRRYDTVFVYHNGAESYYAARGFRGILKI